MAKKDNGKYYLKFNVETRKFALDKMYKTENNFYSIKKVLINESQADEFVSVMTKRYFERESKRNNVIGLTLLEAEFSKFFHVCEECGFVYSHSEYRKYFGKLCKKCNAAHRGEKTAERNRKKARQRKVEKIIEHMDTPQGKIDFVGAKIVYENIRKEMIKQGKDRAELADVIGVTQSRAYEMFYSNKTIQLERLYKISEWLFVPIENLVKPPRGYKPPKKYGVPEHMYRNSIKK